MFRRNKYNHNKSLGSYLYRVFFLIIFFILLKFAKFNVFNDVVFLICGMVAYFLVGFILRKFGIWKY